MQAIPLMLGAMVAAGLTLPSAAAGQQNFNIRVNVAQASYQALREIPVMVSVIKDGAVFRQQKTQLNSSVRFAVPAGLFDVRLEGAGMETLVKGGVQVLEGQDTELIGGPMKAGTGIRIVGYATGGLAREEVAARLAKLDGEVADLKASLAKVETKLAELERPSSRP